MCHRELFVQATRPELESDSVFDMLKKRIAANPDRVKKIGGVFQYNITKDGSTATTWSVYSTHFFCCASALQIHNKYYCYRFQ
jgi:hypothetical protein